MKISAVINTINEEKNIVECLKSLDWVDEIVVVDMESDDKTKELCYKYTKNVFNHKRMGYVEPARNFAIKQAKGDWIIIVDADERVPKELAASLYQIASEDKYNFARIPRKNIAFGEWLKHSRWWPDYNIRFFKKGKVEWQNSIHSVPITYGEGLTLEAKEELSLTHYNYPTINSYFERFYRYTKVQSKELIKKEYKFHWTDLVTKPLNEFFSRFFAGQGYKDGLHGLVLAMLQAFSEFTVYLLVWENQGYKKQTGQNFLKELNQLFEQKFKEFLYWFYTFRLDLTSGLFRRLILRFKRKVTPKL